MMCFVIINKVLLTFYGFGSSRKASKQKDLGSIPLRLLKIMLCRHCLVTLPLTVNGILTPSLPHPEKYPG